jgi:hypothetical protein
VRGFCAGGGIRHAGFAQFSLNKATGTKHVTSSPSLQNPRWLVYSAFPHPNPQV